MYQWKTNLGLHRLLLEKRTKEDTLDALVELATRGGQRAAVAAAHGLARNWEASPPREEGEPTLSEPVDHSRPEVRPGAAGMRYTAEL